MSSLKQFINSPKTVVDEAIQGLLATRHDIERVPGTNSLVVRSLPANTNNNNNTKTTAILCGGGSGHEPAHCAYVGMGLHAAVSGDVFASPSHHAVVATLVNLKKKGAAGVLMVVKNYQGDIINFNLAAKIFAATVDSAFPVEVFVFGDDCAFLSDAAADRSAARGVAGTPLLYQILYAKATQLDAKQLKQLAAQVAARMFTYGYCLQGCCLPGKEKPNVDLADGEMSYGLGIHGEDGVLRVTGGVPPLREIIKRLNDKVFGIALGNENNSKRDFVAMLNNLGGVPELNFGVVISSFLTSDAVSLADNNNTTLKKKATLTPHLSRLCFGRYLTSMDMNGISLTLLVRAEGESDESWAQTLAALEAPAPAGVQCVKPVVCKDDGCVPAMRTDDETNSGKAQTVPESSSAAAVYPWLSGVFAHLASNATAKILDDMDAAVADGDTGRSAARGAEAALAVLRNTSVAIDAADQHLHQQLPSLLGNIGSALADRHAGSSGPLIGAFIAQAGTALQRLLPSLKGGDESAIVAAVAAVLQSATDAVMELGGASPGDRTMVDVLAPVAQAAAKSTALTAKHLAAELLTVAKASAEAAKQLTAKKGRSRYLEQKVVGKADPGCELVVIAISKLAELL